MLLSNFTPCIASQQETKALRMSGPASVMGFWTPNSEAG